MLLNRDLSNRMSVISQVVPLCLWPPVSRLKIHRTDGFFTTPKRNPQRTLLIDRAPVRPTKAPFHGGEAITDPKNKVTGYLKNVDQGSELRLTAGYRFYSWDKGSQQVEHHGLSSGLRTVRRRTSYAPTPPAVALYPLIISHPFTLSSCRLLVGQTPIRLAAGLLQKKSLVADILCYPDDLYFILQPLQDKGRGSLPVGFVREKIRDIRDDLEVSKEIRFIEYLRSWRVFERRDLLCRR